MPMTPPPPGYIERETRRIAAMYANLRRLEAEYGKKSPEAALERADIASAETDLATAKRAAGQA